MSDTVTGSRRSMFTVKELVLISMMTAVTAVCSWISVPSEIPFTLQTFAVFCASGLLGGRNGFFTVLVYILLGAVGIPVFSGGTGGASVLFRASGGYILGFLFIPLACWGFENLFGRRLVASIIAMLAGLVMCYTFGTMWFVRIYTENNDVITLNNALKLCVIPFVIPDLVKLTLAVTITQKIKRSVRI